MTFRLFKNVLSGVRKAFPKMSSQKVGSCLVTSSTDEMEAGPAANVWMPMTPAGRT